ncbi:TM221 protein, partial [Drymodes brunneopygia]|nr:TM221 protein [Drymodes brunneopygia]
ALALLMLLLFEPEAGIAGASILASGILLLLLSLLHSLLRASQISQIPDPSPHSQALYENESAQPGGGSDTAAPPHPRLQKIPREFSFPLFPRRKSQPGSGNSSSTRSGGSGELQRELQREFQQQQRELSRTHRTLEEDSGLLQTRAKPWNVITQEMRNVMARKPPSKDSTLV